MLLSKELNVAAVQFLKKAANARDIQKIMKANNKYWAFGVTVGNKVGKVKIHLPLHSNRLIEL